MDIPSLYATYLRHSTIATDTRKIVPGSIFFALKGAYFDGNAFAAEAIQQGASFAVVSDPSLRGHQYIHVDDTLLALQALASHHRKNLSVPVLAITGSNGKTTTKELISTVMSIRYKTHATLGNLNNHIGVPLTILSTPTDTEFIICEMGANHAGEIKLLCQIADPTHGLITNIGKAHLEGFGSIEGVQRAKGELFDYLRMKEGMAFVNMDDIRLQEISVPLNKKQTYGLEASNQPQILFTYSSVEGQSGFTLENKGHQVKIHSDLFGRYNASNILAAYTIGTYFEVDQNKMVTALSNFVSGANRSEKIAHFGCTVLKDAYNANPSSMELAVSDFAAQYPKGWIILGDMKETGPAEGEVHRQIIELATAKSFERIFLVGNAFFKAYHSLGKTDSRIATADNIESLKKNWHWEDCKGNAILLKGSRSMHLEALLSA